MAASKMSQRCHVIKFLGSANGTDLETGVSWSRIFLEFAPKETLADHIPSNGYASHIALRTFGELLSGLLFIHSLDLVHGDIKPCNILMDKRYKAKIADFGLSRRQVGTTKTIAPGYTRAYAAPEVLRKVPTDGYAADSWAATMTLFVMLTGQKPWKRADVKNTDCLAWTREETHPNWAILNEDEEGFLRRNLDEDPESRVTVQELQQMIRPTPDVKKEEVKPTTQPPSPVVQEITPEVSPAQPRKGRKRSSPKEIVDLGPIQPEEAKEARKKRACRK